MKVNIGFTLNKLIIDRIQYDNKIQKKWIRLSNYDWIAIDELNLFPVYIADASLCPLAWK